MADPIRRPTDAELQILRVLWAEGPCTVRQVLEQLPDEKQVGYTTVLKLLQVMAQKGLVERDETSRSHVYRPVHSEERTQRHLVRDLVERAFGGSAEALVLQALSDDEASSEDLLEIRNLLERMQRRGK